MVFLRTGPFGLRALLHGTIERCQDVEMADYESRKIRGWRGRLEDQTRHMQKRFWGAPVTAVYLPDGKAVSSDKLAGHPRWFNLVYGPEREAAALELRKLTQLKRQIYKSELTEDQHEERRAKRRISDRARRARQSDEQRQARLRQERAWRANRKAQLNDDQIAQQRSEWREAYHRRRAEQTPESRRLQLERKRAKRSRRSAEEIEQERAWFREFRKRQTEEWRIRQNEGLQRRRLANPEMHRAIAKRCFDRTKEARNERRRARYQENPEKYKEASRRRQAADPEHIRALRHAQYLRRKAKQQQSN